MNREAVVDPIRCYPANGLSTFAFLTPVFGVLLGGLLFDKPFTAKPFLALGLIATGLVVMNRPARSKEA